MLDFQIGCIGIGKEKYTKSLFMPHCLLNYVRFVAILLVYALLIKFPVEEFIKQKRENSKLHAEQSFCVIKVFVFLGFFCLLHSRSSL